jgi:hypothetical protein
MVLDWFLLLVLLLAATVNAYQPLKGVTVQCAKESSWQVDIGDWLSDSVETRCLKSYLTTKTKQQRK